MNIILLDSMVLIKKYHLDVFLVKNINNTISVKIIMFINDFEVDLYQKKLCLNIKPNINRNINIIEYIKNFTWSYSKVRINKFQFF